MKLKRIGEWRKGLKQILSSLFNQGYVVTFLYPLVQTSKNIPVTNHTEDGWDPDLV
jgi:hypothetical protein